MRSAAAPSCAATTSQTSTGSAFPFAWMGSAALNANESMVARYVVRLTRMPSVGAADWILAAVLSTSPAADHSPSPGRAPSITSASPVWMPVRMWRSSHSSSSFSSAIPCLTASAARMARSGSSSWAFGVPNSARMASPLNFSKVPPWASSSPRTRAWYGATSDFTSSGSRFSERAVDPTRSTKIAVMTLRSSLGAGAAARGLPQKPQSRNFAGFSSPHEGQTAVCGSAGCGSAARARCRKSRKRGTCRGSPRRSRGRSACFRVYEPVAARSKPRRL